MSLQCPRCHSPKFDSFHHAMKIGAIIGTVGGATRGVSAALAGSQAGAIIGAIAGPLGITLGSISGALCSGLMKPDTHLGENARHIEVSDDQATSCLFR